GSAGKMDPDRSAGQPLDGLAVEAFGGGAGTEERPGSSLDAQGPLRAARLGSFAQPVQGGQGDVRPVGAGRRLDQLDHRPGDKTDVVVFARRLGGGEGRLVL